MFRITKSCQCIVDELTTSQEEADTRMLLHAKHASTDHEAIVILSEDTDVLVLSLGMYNDISQQLYIRCGTSNRMRYIGIAKLGQSLGEETHSALIGLHSFTGCDSISAFGGKGKVSALKLVAKGGRFQKAMANLGINWDLSEELFLLIQEFTCRMYAARSSITEVNEMRYQLFRAKQGNIESGQLPPCEDTLFLHAKRANYQACVWRRCLETEPEVPSAEGHGWIIDDGQLVVQWMQGPPAPDVVMELMACKCSKQCKAPGCQCIANGLKCSPACRNQWCDNMQQDDEDDMLDDDDDYESGVSDVE